MKWKLREFTYLRDRVSASGFFEVEGQRKKGRSKRMWEKQVEEESVKVGFIRIDALCVQSGVLA